MDTEVPPASAPQAHFEDVLAHRTIRDLDAQLAAAYVHAYLDTHWYSAARPHVAMHARRRLRRLGEIYREFAQVPGGPLHDWASDRIAQLPDFARSFDPLPGSWHWLTRSWGVATTATSAALVALPALGVPVGITSVSLLVIAIVNACFCRLWMIATLSIIFTFWFYGLLGFASKQGLFSSVRRTRGAASTIGTSVYELEDQLFAALGRRRQGEVQFDVIAAFGGAAFLATIYGLSTLLEGYEGFRWHFDWPWYSHPLTWAAIWTLLGTFLAVNSAGRKWGWRGSKAPPSDR